MGRTSRGAFVVGGVAALLRLTWVSTIAREPKGLGDPLFYLLFAKGISSGRGYVSASGHPTAYYPPGYPYFLGVIQWVLDRLGLASQMVSVTLVVQALMGAATAGIMVIATRRITGPVLGAARAHRSGMIAGSIVALWPNLIVQTGLVLSETLFLFLFVALLAAVASIVDDRRSTTGTRTRNLIIGATLFASCVVVRPQSTLLVLPLIVMVLVACRRDRREILAIAGVFTAALLIVLTPWTIRNAVQLHAFIPITTNTGDNLCMGFNPDANGGFLYNEYCVTDAMYLDGTASEVRQNKEKTAKAVRWATQNLTALPRLSVSKVRITMENDVDALWGLQSFGHDVFIVDRTFWAMKLVANTYYRVVAALAVVGTVVSLIRVRRAVIRPPGMWIMLGLIPAGLLVPILSFGDPRFKAPLIPSIALFAAVALGDLVDRSELVRQRRSGHVESGTTTASGTPATGDGFSGGSAGTHPMLP